MQGGPLSRIDCAAKRLAPPDERPLDGRAPGHTRAGGPTESTCQQAVAFDRGWMLVTDCSNGVQSGSHGVPSNANCPDVPPLCQAAHDTAVAIAKILLLAALDRQKAGATLTGASAGSESRTLGSVPGGNEPSIEEWAQPSRHGPTSSIEAV
jgi:hypothetical protein